MNKVYNYYNKNLLKIRRGKSIAKDPSSAFKPVKTNKENMKTENDQPSLFQQVYQKLTKQYKINIVPRKGAVSTKKQSKSQSFQNQKLKLKTQQSFPVIANPSPKNKEVTARPFHSVQRKRISNQSVSQTAQITDQKVSKRYAPIPYYNISYKKKNLSYNYNSLLMDELLDDEFSTQNAQKIELDITNNSNNIELFMEIILHYNRFCDIQVACNSTIKNNEDQILQSIKQYILQNDNSDISKLDKIFLEETWKKKAKEFVFLERIAVILIVEYIVRGKYKNERKNLKSNLSVIKQQYISLFQLIVKSFEDNGIAEKIPKEIPVILGQQNLQLKPIKSLFKQNQNLIKKIEKMTKFPQSFANFFEFTLKNIQNYTINLCFYRILEFYALHLALHQNQESIVPFLSTCPSPYLHYPTKKQYTLVLDLDETLVHYTQYKTFGEFKTRPYAQQFIKQLSEYFQIGIFTCGMPDYADWVIKHFQGIEFTLYRYHAIKTKGGFIKDLSRIGRDLKKLIMVDNLPQNFKLTPQNGIQIKSWYDDVTDKELLELCGILKEVVSLNYDDIRVSLKHVLQKKQPQKKINKT